MISETNNEIYTYTIAVYNLCCVSLPSTKKSNKNQCFGTTTPDLNALKTHIMQNYGVDNKFGIFCILERFEIDLSKTKFGWIAGGNARLCVEASLILAFVFFVYPFHTHRNQSGFDEYIAHTHPKRYVHDGSQSKVSINARARNNESGADIWLIFGVTLIDCCIYAHDIFPSFLCVVWQSTRSGRNKATNKMEG